MEKKRWKFYRIRNLSLNLNQCKSPRVQWIHLVVEAGEANNTFRMLRLFKHYFSYLFISKTHTNVIRVNVNILPGIVETVQHCI